MLLGHRIVYLWLFIAMGMGLNMAVVARVGIAQDETTTRTQAQQLFKQGNWKDAFELFRRLTESPTTAPSKVHEDLASAVNCLNNLGLMENLDQVLKSAVQAHPTNWRILAQASESLVQAPHHGLISSNVFRRAPQRGDSGTWVYVHDQDRTQSLRWLEQAIPLVEVEPDKSSRAKFYAQLTRVILEQRSQQSSWQLQSKTDLQSDPVYNEVDNLAANQSTRFAPVDLDGRPVLHATIETWLQATSDGQRLRWAIDRWTRDDATSAKLFWADFLNGQFGVQTLAGDQMFYRFQSSFAKSDDANQSSKDSKSKNQSGVYALHTLEETESIARLANGIKRFTLTDEFNPIRIYQQILRDESRNKNAYSQLVNIFTNRRQYTKAAELCRQAIAAKVDVAQFTSTLAAIVNPRGRFESVETQVAGKPATVDFVFRNASRATFTAHRVDIDKLETDIKQFYRTYRPDQPPNFAGVKNHYPPSIEAPTQLFNSLKMDQYLKGTMAEWTLELKPRDNHWDRRIQVATPLQQPGLYVVTVKLEKPDYVARCLVRIQDTTIVRKPLANQFLYYVADALTGKPIPNANVEFFGFTHEYNNGRAQPVKIANFAKKTADDGQVYVVESDMPTNYQWMVTARTSAGGVATLGFENLWYSGFNGESPPQQLKAYGISDRPAYRPGDTIKAKFWFALADYSKTIEQSDKATQEGSQYAVRLVDPQGTAIWTGNIATDRFGGGDIELPIPKDVKLGAYHFQIHDGQIPTELMIRIEEYRKPEFEVTIEAPKAPIKLGEKFETTVRAKYYFGSPVASAEASIKVTRTAFKDAYYPVRPYDWCYGSGYWWTAYDLPWYPGWAKWQGCVRPMMLWWFSRFNEESPELVLQQDVTLDVNGEAKIEIDSATALAFQSDSDHRYRIEVDVRDASRRTLSSSGEVIASRQSFKIYSWGDRGYYNAGDKIVASFQARTLGGKSIASTGKLELFRISYDPNREPIEMLVDSWDVATDTEGNLTHTLQAGRPGQYRLKLRLKDEAQNAVEGGYLITVRGDNTQGTDFRFSALEIVPDKSEYSIGDVARIQINADRDDAMVMLFLRPQGGIYPKSQVVQLKAKSSIVEIPITAADQPNFFVEAFTIYDGEFHQEAREIFVPPEQRVIDVEVKTDKSEYLPGEEAEVEITLKDVHGEPVEGSAVLAVYDRALDQIAPDAIPPDIRAFFWKWRRQHHPTASENLSQDTPPIYIEKMQSADALGIFGSSMANDGDALDDDQRKKGAVPKLRSMRSLGMPGGAREEMSMDMLSKSAPMAAAPMSATMGGAAMAIEAQGEGGSGAAAAKPPTIRKDFADAAYWLANISFDRSGKSTAKFKMPENLTSWQIGVWSMGSGVRVGSGSVQTVTRKNLMVRLQTPRFLVDSDEVIASALVNNEFPDAVEVEVELQQTGDQLQLLDASMTKQTITVPAHGQKRVDWRCRAVKPGEATLRVTAISSRESDAMQLKLPVIVRGILKTESFAGTVRANQSQSIISLTVPEQRLADQSNLTIRVSPSLALSMVDALPYMVDYPYGCTEQTLNRFVPTVITYQTLVKMGIDLQSIRDNRVNLNAQELGEPADRVARWKRFDRNPVFDNVEVAKMVEVGLRRITEMQLSDGGWGWFSGLQERSWPHTTAVVVRGLMAAKEADAAIVPDCLSRGLDWLTRYQTGELEKLKNAPSKVIPYKELPDDLDAFVFHILVLADRPSVEMQSYLYEKRNALSVHSKALLAIATHKLGQVAQTNMLRQNIEQFLVEDTENETAFLRDQSPWWYWYGSPIEATAMYLKLLAKVDPKGVTAPRLVKYLLNNRKHATYWNSTRDTALVIEAFADFLGATNEGSLDVRGDIFLDGQSIGAVTFNAKNIFDGRNTIEISGDAIKPGAHRLEIRRAGQGSLYWNVYQTNFTMEAEIGAAGLEIKVDRKFYRCIETKKDLVMAGDRGQLGGGQRSSLDRQPIRDLAELRSGEMIEVELLIESKNDYEYLMLTDPKAASCEPIETTSGYAFVNGLAVYREFRDQHVTFFLRSLPRGSHSMRYRLRCEAPGRFTALPATAIGMYAPELAANSADFDVSIVDSELVK